MPKKRKLTNVELNRPSIQTYKAQQKAPLIIILDNIRSLNNIGSIFRTADAFAIQEILLCGISAKPPHREINKTALGATASVDWKYFKETLEAIHYLKSKEWKIFAIEQAENSIPLNEYKPQINEKTAYIFGHEVNGVSQEAIDLCDDVIEIPQQGTKHSLNIAVSVGLVLWDVSNKINLYKLA